MASDNPAEDSPTLAFRRSPTDSQFDIAAEPIVDPRRDLPLALGVRHFLAWMTFTAIGMSVQRLAFGNPGPATAAGDEWLHSPLAAVQVAATSIALGGHLLVLSCVAMWRRRGYRWQMEPGQWISVYAVASWACSLVYLPLAARSANPRPGAMVSAPGVMVLLALFAFAVIVVGTIFFARLALRTKEGRWWKFVYTSLALLCFRWIGGAVLMFFLLLVLNTRSVKLMFLAPAAASGLAAVAIGGGILSDRREKRWRHWSHWMGAGFMLAESVVMTLLYGIIALYFF